MVRSQEPARRCDAAAFLFVRRLRGTCIGRTRTQLPPPAPAVALLAPTLSLPVHPTPPHPTCRPRAGGGVPRHDGLLCEDGAGGGHPGAWCRSGQYRSGRHRRGRRARPLPQATAASHAQPAACHGPSANTHTRHHHRNRRHHHLTCPPASVTRLTHLLRLPCPPCPLPPPSPPQALFKGLAPNYVKVVPSIAIAFVTYEQVCGVGWGMCARVVCVSVCGVCGCACGMVLPRWFASALSWFVFLLALARPAVFGTCRLGACRLWWPCVAYQTAAVPLTTTACRS